MSLAKASIWIFTSTFVKLVVGLLMIKLLAISFGPSGVGQAGNFRRLLTVLGVLAGAGILNGVTKYVAQYHDVANMLRAIVGTSTAIVMGCSTLLILVFLLAAAPISQKLFGHSQYQWIVRLASLMQIGIAWANLILAMMKGFRDVVGNSITLITGSVIGIIAYYLCYLLGGYEGTLFGLALVPTLLVIPAMLILVYKGNIPLSYFKPRWNAALAGQLGKFALMALITSFTVPTAYWIMRNLLILHYNWDEAGIWQGMISISDAYLQFTTALFSVWLLPRMSRLNGKQAIMHEIFYSLRTALPAVVSVSLCIWLLRDMAIWLMFSENFNNMRDLFAWELIGDTLKVGVYVFGYMIIAKSSLLTYILAELSQFTLLVSFSHLLIPKHGALGASQAYMATYIIYFFACFGIFLIWSRRM